MYQILDLTILFYFSEHKDEDFKENLKYSIQRLISGLASDRITSRKGYFTCLVYMLQAFEEEISVKTVFELVTKLLNVKGSKSVSLISRKILQNR